MHLDRRKKECVDNILKIVIKRQKKIGPREMA